MGKDVFDGCFVLHEISDYLMLFEFDHRVVCLQVKSHFRCVLCIDFDDVKALIASLLCELFSFSYDLLAFVS